MNLKRIMMIAIPIIVIAIIIYIMKVRNDKYYKINPIFHPLGKDAKKEDIVEEKPPEKGCSFQGRCHVY